MRLLRTHSNKHNDSYYYRIRDTQPTSLAARAARFLYLNRTCWNGLYMCPTIQSKIGMTSFVGRVSSMFRVETHRDFASEISS